MVIRVVVADDHALVRDGVVSLLGTAEDVEVVGTADDLPGLLRMVDELTPDVVITDIRMPPTFADEGVEAATSICRRHLGTGVVVLTMYAEPEYARALLGEGTAGRAYLLKSRVRDVDELLHAVRSVAAGESVVDPRIVDVLLSPSGAAPVGRLAELSQREREVLAAMAAGCSNSAIAEQLYMSSKTVEKHVRAIFTKLDIPEEPTVNRRVAAVVRWLERAR
jgi:DNA-binding NarL/FixJ family response regulator